jgi:CRISPR/Cas system-associated exonuclease Cas4 (RecB family)
MSELKLSASLYQRFLVCPQSAVFSVDLNFRELKKRSLRAALGIISHNLVEKSVRIPQEWSKEEISRWFESNWNELVENQYIELTQQWFPNLVPKPQSWRGYFATYAAAKTLVIKNSGLLPPKSPELQKSTSDSHNDEGYVMPLIERYLISQNYRIVGKPDYVFLENNQATIVDYKFGNSQDDLDKHKIQMLFYKLLVEDVMKVKVGKLSVVASENRIWEIVCKDSELKFLEQDIPRVLEAITSNKVAAIPSLQNCKYCPYKSVCEPFKKANIELQPDRPMAIFGEVLQILNVSPKMQELRLKSSVGPKGAELKIFGIPSDYVINVGDSVFLSDNLDFIDEKIVGFSWDSRISIQG